MTNIVSNRYTNIVLPAAFFFLLLLNHLTVTTYPVREPAFIWLEGTYYISLVILGFMLGKYSFSYRNLPTFYLGISLSAAVYIFVHLLHRDFEDNSALMHVLLTLAFVLAMTHVKWERKHITLFAYICSVCIILFFIGWIYIGQPLSSFYVWTRNPNIGGVLLSCLLFFPVVSFADARRWQKMLFILVILLGCVMVFASSARAVLLLLLTAAAARLVLLLSKKIFFYLFHLTLLLNGLFLFVYSSIDALPFFSRLNDWSLDTFGKELFSGRQNIWGDGIAYGGEAFLFGHQVAIVPSDFMDTHYVHTHNQYLQIFLESGLAGIICFILLLFGIWRVYSKGLDHPVVRWSACFFLGILVYQSLEISLFFNMPPIGLMQWLIISVGVSSVLYRRQTPGRRSSRIE